MKAKLEKEFDEFKGNDELTPDAFTLKETVTALMGLLETQTDLYSDAKQKLAESRKQEKPRVLSFESSDVFDLEPQIDGRNMIDLGISLERLKRRLRQLKNENVEKGRKHKEEIDQLEFEIRTLRE